MRESQVEDQDGTQKEAPMANMFQSVLIEQKMIYEERIAQLIQERDEARREICFNKAADMSEGIGSSTVPYHPSVPRNYAKGRNWDCFADFHDDWTKENQLKWEADQNNTLFRTTDGE